MRKRMILPALALCLSAMLAAPAGALEYTIETDKPPNYGTPTSVETVITPDGGKMKNEDLSKNAAIIPPGFGTPTSYVLNTGEYLTPNLVAGQMAQGGISGSSGVVVSPPDITGATTPNPEIQDGSANISQSFIPGAAANSTTGFTGVTDDLYYANGSLGTLKIPAIGLNVKIYEGTGDVSLAKGIGHFESTSIWSGNVALAGHNRGVNTYFGKIHTLEQGDKITLTTKLGTRTYAVTSVSKISEKDWSGLNATGRNQITLYTCVRDQGAYRWCVTAMEVV